MPVILKEGKDTIRILDPFYAGEWEMDDEALMAYFDFLKYIEELSLDDSVRFPEKAIVDCGGAAHAREAGGDALCVKAARHRLACERLLLR